MHLFKGGGTSVIWGWELGEHSESPTLCALPDDRAGLVRAETLPLLLLLCLESPHRSHIWEPATAPENPSEDQGAEGAEGAPKASPSELNSSPLLRKVRIRDGDWAEVS